MNPFQSAGVIMCIVSAAVIGGLVGRDGPAGEITGFGWLMIGALVIGTICTVMGFLFDD